MGNTSTSGNYEHLQPTTSWPLHTTHWPSVHYAGSSPTEDPFEDPSFRSLAHEENADGLVSKLIMKYVSTTTEHPVYGVLGDHPVFSGANSSYDVFSNLKVVLGELPSVLLNGSQGMTENDENGLGSESIRGTTSIAAGIVGAAIMSSSNGLSGSASGVSGHQVKWHNLFIE